MPLNKLFDVVERARDTAQWRAAFGEPQQFGEKTVIPVAQVSYGFGLGFGHGSDLPTEEALGVEGGEGAGGGAVARPLGVIVVQGDDVYFEETVDASRISLAGIVLAGVIVVQVASTVRALFRRK